MKILISDKDLIKEQKNAQKKCIEFIGKGEITVEELENIVEILEKTNQELRKKCKRNKETSTITCGGSCEKVEIPLIVQSKLYQDNKSLVNALLFNIRIAKANNLNKVKDFKFNDKEIINYNK